MPTEVTTVQRPGEMQVTPDGATAFLALVERAARDPAVDIDKMERLLQMQERVVSKQAEAEFNTAMSAAQAEMGAVGKDATNPHTRSKYATYDKLDRMIRPIYTKHGFALSFDEGKADREGFVRVLCVVSHRAGFSRIYHTDMPADGKGAKGGDVMTPTHAHGAAKAYGMRYLLRGIFNIAIGEEDRDGNDDDAPRITEKQAADMLAMLTELGPKAHGNFLKAIKAKSLAEIRAENYDACLGMIKRKRAE